jgi:hypothetical protein
MEQVYSSEQPGLSNYAAIFHVQQSDILNTRNDRENKATVPYLYFREDKGAVTSFELGLQSVQAEDLPAVKQHPFGQLTYQEINN